MNADQKSEFIKKNISEAKSIMYTFVSIIEAHKNLPVPIAESMLPLPKTKFIWAQKYMAAYLWFRDDEGEKSFSALNFKEAYLAEHNEAIIVDWTKWPNYAHSLWNYYIASPNGFAEYWPDREVRLVKHVTREDWYSRNMIRLNYPRDWKEKLERNPDPTSDALIRISNNLNLGLIDFLLSLEDYRRDGFDKYWTEVHGKLGMEPPPFAPKSGCLFALCFFFIMIWVTSSGVAIVLSS